MNKKGLAMTELAKLIIFLVVLIVLFMLVVEIYIKSKATTDTELCRLSVITRAKAKLLGKPVMQKLECYTRDIKIKTEGAYLKNKRMTKYKDDFDNNVKSTIAEELKNCWQQFAQGDYNPFEENVAFGDINHCVICSVIKFEPDLPQDEIKDFHDWLLSNPIPGSKLTYAGYLAAQKITTDVNKVELLATLASAGSPFFPFIYYAASDSDDRERKYIPFSPDNMLSLKEPLMVVFYMYSPVWISSFKWTPIHDTKMAMLIVTPTKNTKELECQKLY